MRIAFFGTPDFAVPTLDALVREHEVVLAVAQPDKPAGRGMKMQSPAVAVRARALGLPLVQPAKIRTDEFLDAVRLTKPDVGIVIAYGRILPKALLEIPRHGFLNVHASILPFWRGAAPIQRSIEAGERETGVTIMRVDEELDHGPTFSIVTTSVAPEERTPSLASRLSMLGADALLPVLRDLDAGRAIETPQDHARATLAPKIEKGEGRVDFALSAQKIYDRFRAFDPWPGIFFETGGEIVKITDVVPVDGSGAPGEVLSIGGGLTVGTGDRALLLRELQPAGKPRTAAAVVAQRFGWRAGSAIVQRDSE